MVEIPSRSEAIEQARSKGKLLAGVFPIHYPRELLRAFNIHPVEIWGPPMVDPKGGAAHLQPYICSIVRNGLSFLLEKASKVVDLLVVPHGCDSLQGLGSLLLDLLRIEKPVLVFYPPRGKGDCALEFLTREIENLYRALADITGYTPTDSALLESVKIEEEVEDRLLALYRNRAILGLSSLEFYRLVRAREYMDPEDLLSVYKEVLKGKGKSLPGGKPVLMSGILPEPMEMLESIDSMGAYVAGDDYAACRRRIYGKGKSRDPIVRMAERMLNSPPDSTKGSSFEERISFLRRLIEETGAKAVVFHNVKFCEAEEFYHPILMRELRKLGVKSVKVEVDLSDPLPQQVLTRIRALVESVGDGSP